MREAEKDGKMYVYAMSSASLHADIVRSKRMSGPAGPRMTHAERICGGNMETDYKIIRIIDVPEMKERAAEWFHEKWGIPLSAYIESMEEALKGVSSVPQWYVAVEQDRIIGGMGVIENDFHNRKDLTPNVCAVYVEEDKRCQGIAGKLLEFVCEDMQKRGIDTLYLITDHIGFYERYGWEFLCMVQGDDEPEMSRMYIHNCHNILTEI